MGLIFSRYYSKLNKAMKEAKKAYKEQRWSDCYWASRQASDFLGDAYRVGDLADSVYLEWGEEIDKMMLESDNRR